MACFRKMAFFAFAEQALLDKPPDRVKPPARPFGRMHGLHYGLQFGLTAIVGLAVGHWLDGRVLPAPVGTLGGLFGGAVVGMVVLVRELKK
ncbi:MAG: AtpZ/AtpI family protein [Elusimicrobiota bacterium]|jgi:hypothetical protein